MPPPARLFAAAFGSCVLSLSAVRTPRCAAPSGDPAPAGQTTVTINAAAPGKPISPELFGVFFEDISYAADGGLYAELIQNRSFEYQAAGQPAWNNLSFWEPVARGDGKVALFIDDALPVHPNNPHYAVVDASASKAGGDTGAGLMNPGFDGIPVRAGESYELALFARKNFTGGRWDAVRQTGPLALSARLESKDGGLLAEAALAVSSGEWRRLTATLTAAKSDPEARFVLLMQTRGGTALDEISLFPKKTFRNRPNGLRADLAETIAALKPRFVRFPGGCIVHGNGLGNMYRWKDTIGPVEQRRQQANLWRYHQTAGLGYHEYFQFCEDIGAQPLPVVPAGVSCQNSAYQGGTGQRGLPLEDMPACIQDVLDLIEWANGPATSAWGAKRAAAGHPAPFNLRHIGVGNEEHITPVFRERFAMIYDAVKKAHPEITVIGTAGPSWKGDDYDNGWKIADELRVPMVDEHYYETPAWFWQNLRRYDGYDRAKSRVYVGEYAAHDERRRPTLRSAIAEAAYLTGLERNGDIVHFASYAPLLARRGQTRWNPDLIYFTNTDVYPTINYHVQRLFGANAGDAYLETTITPAPARPSATPDFAASAVRDSATGDIIIKLVNGAAAPRPVRVTLAGFDPDKYLPAAIVTTLGGNDPGAVNDYDSPASVLPEQSAMKISPAFTCDIPANSLAVLRLAAKPAKTPKPGGNDVSGGGPP
jgi:alpha-L-arabinofuranosidase